MVELAGTSVTLLIKPFLSKMAIRHSVSSYDGDLPNTMYGLKFDLPICCLYSEWSTLEEEMGDGLQKTGHYMDRYILQLLFCHLSKQ